MTAAGVYIHTRKTQVWTDYGCGVFVFGAQKQERTFTSLMLSRSLILPIKTKTTD